MRHLYFYVLFWYIFVFLCRNAGRLEHTYTLPSTYTSSCPLFQAICSLPFLYMLSFLMASPIFFHSHLHVPNIVADGGTGSNYEDDEDDYLSHLVFCIEDWNYHGKSSFVCWSIRGFDLRVPSRSFHNFGASKSVKKNFPYYVDISLIGGFWTSKMDGRVGSKYIVVSYSISVDHLELGTA